MSALQWQRVIMRLDQPSVEMINVVCKARPMFLEWVHFGGIFSPLQVDPSDKKSIAEWKKHEKRNWKIFERAIVRTINEQSEKEDS